MQQQVLSSRSNVEAQFRTQMKSNLLSHIVSSLNKAENEVLVAIYWITDDSIIDTLIALQKKGVNVRLMFDESTPDIDVVLPKLLDAGIVPIINPSLDVDSLMHNKFVVVDGQIVLTGAANFTTKALNPESKNFSYENIVTLYDQNVAQKFRANFLKVEQSIFEDCLSVFFDESDESFYISSDEDVAWLDDMLPRWYEKNTAFRREVAKLLKRSNTDQKRDIRSFFNMKKSSRPKNITPKQVVWLRSKGVSPAGMSKQQAPARIGSLIQQEKYNRSGRRG
jgi:phosphatidylserine/phosphatidylglycerophosphate/cardiolipin synthase-like enzyme